MSSTVEIVNVLKSELKLARLTYADLGRELGLAESSVKRMFAKGDMPLKRIDEICRVLRCDFSELARKVADLELLRAVIAVSPIVVNGDEFSRPVTDWAAIRQSDDVDAFVLGWLASHVRDGLGGNSH